MATTNRTRGFRSHNRSGNTQRGSSTRGYRGIGDENYERGYREFEDEFEGRNRSQGRFGMEEEEGGRGYSGRSEGYGDDGEGFYDEEESDYVFANRGSSGMRGSRWGSDRDVYENRNESRGGYGYEEDDQPSTYRGESGGWGSEREQGSSGGGQRRFRRRISSQGGYGSRVQGSSQRNEPSYEWDVDDSGRYESEQGSSGWGRREEEGGYGRREHEGSYGRREHEGSYGRREHEGSYGRREHESRFEQEGRTGSRGQGRGTGRIRNEQRRPVSRHSGGYQGSRRRSRSNY